MRKVSYKIVSLVVFTVVFSSVSAAWLALREFSSSKEEEVVEKTARVVISISHIIGESKDLNSARIKEVISSYPHFGVGIIDLHMKQILESNGSLNLSDEQWAELKQKASGAAVFSQTMKTAFLSAGKIPGTNYVIVAVTPRTTVWHLVKVNFRSYLLLLVFMTLVLGLMAVWVARAMVRPIEELREKTELLSEGKWDINFTNNSRDEIGELSRAFHRMAISLRDRESKIRFMHEELALSEKLAMIGQFSAGIAHEIKNPLASMSTHLQLLERQANKPSEDFVTRVKEKCTLFGEEIERANKIITDVLGFSRQDRINKTSVDAKTYLTHLRDDLAPVAEKSNAELTLRWFGNDLMLEIDQDKIRQVFSNLLSNSLDAFDGKGGRIEWRVEPGQSLKVHVIDDGPGIPEENRKKLFDPFFTSKPAGKGTGLGLSVCHGIIKQHGGTLQVMPSSKGAHFMIELEGPTSGA